MWPRNSITCSRVTGPTPSIRATPPGSPRSIASDMCTYRVAFGSSFRGSTWLGLVNGVGSPVIPPVPVPPQAGQGDGTGAGSSASFCDGCTSPSPMTSGSSLTGVVRAASSASRGSVGSSDRLTVAGVAVLPAASSRASRRRHRRRRCRRRPRRRPRRGQDRRWPRWPVGRPTPAARAPEEERRGSRPPWTAAHPRCPSSPFRSRICAIRSTIAWKKITSPALARAMSVLIPYSVDWPVRTNRAIAAAFARSSAASRVGLDDLGLHQRLEPPPRQRRHVRRRHRVHPPGLVQVQPGGRARLGDLPGLPHPTPPLGQRRPQLRVPVPHVQRVPNEMVRGDVTHPEQGTELHRRELRHQRRPVRTHLLRPLHPRQHPPPRPTPLVGQRLTGVQVGPVRGQVEPGRLRTQQIGLRLDGHGTRRVTVQVTDPLQLEHESNIPSSTDSFVRQVFLQGRYG